MISSIFGKNIHSDFLESTCPPNFEELNGGCFASSVSIMKQAVAQTVMRAPLKQLKVRICSM